MKTHYFYTVFLVFLVGPVTLKKPVKASIQVFSDRTTKPFFFFFETEAKDLPQSIN
jgi:hypothetical protein